MGYRYDPTDGAVLYGPDGEVVWSSSRRQAYWTDHFSGSFTVPAISGSSIGVYSNVVTDIATVDPVATDLMGWFTASSADLSGIQSGGTHQLGGTTLLTVFYAGERLNVSTWAAGMYPDSLNPNWVAYTTSTRQNYCGGISVATWVEAGKVKARVQRYRPGDFSANFSAMTINFWGFALAFDN